MPNERELPNTAGLYALVGKRHVLYVGKTKHLRRRLGQFIGGACGGFSLHSGGWKLYEHFDRVPHPRGPANLTFVVFVGHRAYTKERAVIRAVRPLMNGRWPRD
jgi:hypothetical protein